MNDETPNGSVTIERFLDKDREAIFAIGQFDALFQAYAEHAQLWGHDSSPLTGLMMQQALSGCALYLSCRPTDEVSAFTLNITQPPTNIFVAGSANELQVTGRPWTKDVNDKGESRLFVQTQRRKGEDSTSVIDVEGIDVLMIFEQYCRRSDQAPARFFDLEDGRFLMVASLPREDRHWLEGLDRDLALKGLEGLAKLDEKVFWFQCGCDPSVLAHALKAMYKGRVDDLFQEDDSLQAECPRCGRTWQIKRDLFEGGEQ